MLSLFDTQTAIGLLKRLFEDKLAAAKEALEEFSRETGTTASAFSDVGGSKVGEFNTENGSR